MTTNPSTDHEARANLKILQIVKRPRISALVSVRARRWQGVESCAWELASYALDIDLAFGAGLAAIGRLIGRGRNGADDPTYRIALRVWQIVLRSRGRISDVTKILDALSIDAHVVEWTKAFALVLDQTLDAAAWQTLRELVSEVRPLGTRVWFSVDAVGPPTAPDRRAIGGYYATYDPGDGHESGYYALSDSRFGLTSYILAG